MHHTTIERRFPASPVSSRHLEGGGVWKMSKTRTPQRFSRRNGPCSYALPRHEILFPHDHGTVSDLAGIHTIYPHTERVQASTVQITRLTPRRRSPGPGRRYRAPAVGHRADRSIGLKVLGGQGAAIDTTTAAGRLSFGIFAALAEFESELNRTNKPSDDSHIHVRDGIVPGVVELQRVADSMIVDSTRPAIAGYRVGTEHPKHG